MTKLDDDYIDKLNKIIKQQKKLLDKQEELIKQSVAIRMENLRILEEMYEDEFYFTNYENILQ